MMRKKNISSRRDFDGQKIKGFLVNRNVDDDDDDQLKKCRCIISKTYFFAVLFSVFLRDKS